MPATTNQRRWMPAKRRAEPQLLMSYSMPWQGASLIPFLQQGMGQPRVYWESSRSELSFAGYGATAVLTATGPNRFATIHHKTDALFKRVVTAVSNNIPATVRPRLFGGFSFTDSSQPDGLWAQFPAAYFVLPRYLLTSYQGQTWLTINEWVNGAANSKWQVATIPPHIHNSQFTIHNSSFPPSFLQIEDLVGQPAWETSVQQATSRIRQGELQKVVLARPRRVQSASPVEITAVLSTLQSRYPDCYRFLIEPAPGHAFFGATPELLAEVNNQQLYTVALAGSIRRGQTPEEDTALGAELLTNAKEREEHEWVVKAVMENLRPFTSHLHLPPTPAVYRLNNIQHLKTPIQATLNQGTGILPVIEALHPTPALGGTPRQTALRLIAELEPFSRGWYAAPVGWLDAQGDGLFAVAIRSAVTNGQETHLFAGAGIVADSNPQREWQETSLKFRPMMEAIASEQ